MATITDLIERVGTINAANGWHDRYAHLVDLDDHEGAVEHVFCKIALISTEVAEALEELRNGRPADSTYYLPEKPTKPEGVPSELADVVIRVLDIAFILGIDLGAAIETKLAYNGTRGHMHGGKSL